MKRVGIAAGIILAIIVMTNLSLNYFRQPASDPDPETVITYTNNGFEPTMNRVHALKYLLMINRSDHDLQVASDPHPSHEANYEFNSNITMKPGEEFKVQLTNKGTWGLHNHLKPEHGATLIVE